MPTTLLFHFEDNIASIQSGRDIDMEVWRNLVYAFNIDKYICVDCTECGIRYEDVNKDFEKINCLATFKNNNPNIQFIYLMPLNSNIEGIEVQDLKDFIHPVDNVCYIIGRDSCGLHNVEQILSD